MNGESSRGIHRCRVRHCILIPILAAWAWCGMAADVPARGGSAQRQRQDFAATEFPGSGPAGRGRLPLPNEITLPDLDPAAKVQHRPDWLGPVQPLPAEIGGTWAWTQEGKRVWRVTIRVAGARALRVRFESFNIQGAVWLYGDEWSGPQIGPYKGGGPHRDGSFWSEFVFAEVVTIEYVPDDPATGSERVPFRVRSVAQIVDEGFPVPGGRRKARVPQWPQPRSLAGCHLDVSCYPDLQKRDQPSVARLYITNADGTSTCTGFLINPNYDSDSRLLFLTAGHCISTKEEALDASFLWNYQTEACYGNPDWRQWAKPLAYTYGATLVVSKDDQYDDFALLVLSKADVRAVTGWWAEGWTTTEVRVGDQVSTVTHPDGNFKRAAIGQVVNHRWANYNSLGTKTIQWRLGTTEPGSSGSPVFKGTGEDRRVVGVLVGGNGASRDNGSLWGPYCDADLRVAFNRLDHIYDTIKPYMESESQLVGVVAAPKLIEVPLGSTGEMVTLVQAEDGSWWTGGGLVASGETAVRTENGNVYTLVLAPDGTWSAAYSAERVRVGLGTSSYIVTLVRAEDGSWWYGDRAVESGSMIATPKGTWYRLSWRGGRWVAEEVTG